MKAGFFSHIYVEKDILEAPKTQELISRLPNSEIIEINHYKDVFCRSRQDFAKQKKSPALILAHKKGELIYEGAKVCQSFGNAHFYYTSCIMNCVYNCEYCYLSGMYPSGNIVIFMNLEDYFEEISRTLLKNPMYICVSYDTDLLALNHLTGVLNRWIEFVDTKENLSIEIRTKCGNISSVKESLKCCKHPERIIFAFTVSPEAVIERYEKGTASLTARLKALAELQELKIPCRIAFDPMIYLPDWKPVYEEMADIIFKGRDNYPKIDCNKIFDVSIGSFRISDTYLKNMRRNLPSSAITQFPYDNDGGVYHYPDEIMKEMEAYMLGRCRKILPEDKIFLWKEQ
ncbi:MAG: radical SAM protein [Lachnospiraceae bacterium]|nr:radical SAM protein [Lachnospiraceae bacterium]